LPAKLASQAAASDSGAPHLIRAGYPLDTVGPGATRTRRRTNKKSPARRDGAWKVGGSNYESFSGFNLTWLMAFVGSEALRLTRVAESAA
jgi:hypothetical protein